MEKIVALDPDLIITYSDVQAEIARDIVRLGLPVLALNHHTLAGIADTIRLLGKITDCRDLGNEMAEDFLRKLICLTVQPIHRPKVYFEEWPEPLIHGARWISEAIHLAGACDIFPQSISSKAESRVRRPQEIMESNPDVIIASWCGKPVDFQTIRNRPGWSNIAAVKNGRIFEIAGSDILQAGPRLLRGIVQLREIIARCQTPWHH